MAEQVVSKTAKGVHIEVWVVPGASRTEVVGIHGSALRVRVAAPPEGGQANRRIEEHFADLLGSEVRVEKGTRHRRKVLFVANGDVSVVRRKLRLTD